MSVFQGLKVIDCASYIAAPSAATIFADYGAEVIKIEPPGAGDPYRTIVQLPNLPKAEQNYAWQLVSRGKSSLALDLSKPAGQAVLHRLVREADVFITNYPNEVRGRLGVDYDRLEGLNLRLIYASLSGYGETGEEAGRRGFDANAWWARTGLADLVRPDHEAPPVAPTMAMGDQPTGAMFYGAIVTALFHRERTGKGGRVATSLLASGVWANGPNIQAVLCGGHVPKRMPRSAARSALGLYYRCRDGRWFVVSIAQETRDWPKLCALVGRPELVTDPRFATAPDRLANVQALMGILEAAYATEDAATWQQRCDAAGLTAATAVKVEDLAGDAQPQLIAAQALVPSEAVPHSGLEVASPFTIDGVQKTAPRRAPEVGEHSGAVLAANGFTAEEIAALRSAGVIA